MSKKPTRLKKLRLTELSLVSAGANQFSTVSVAKHFVPADIRDPVTEPLNLAPEQLEKSYQWAREYLKSLEDEKMTKPSQTEAMIQKYMDRHDVSRTEAFSKLMGRAEWAEAYEQDQQAYLQRQVDARNKVYGDGQ